MTRSGPKIKLLETGDRKAAATTRARNCAPAAPPVDGILGAIGSTPLVRLSRFLDREDIELYAKIESLNPGGSMKDRPAAMMLNRAIETGRVGPKTLVVESSSGNMGIGLAQACRYHGVRFRCVIDPRAAQQNVQIMRAYGAEIELVTEPDKETGDLLVARLQRVREILASEADAYWPNQYANATNALSHRNGTMREIDEALGGSQDVVFVATSSTGTMRGCADYLRSHGRSAGLIAVDAVGSVLFGGRAAPRQIPGLGAGIVPPLAKNARHDDVVRVSAIDCVVGCRRLIDREGILAGGSAGGVASAIRRFTPLLPEGSVCVAVLADSGTRYLDTVYSDEWVESELGVSPDEVQRAVAEPDPVAIGTGLAS